MEGRGVDEGEGKVRGRVLEKVGMRNMMFKIVRFSLLGKVR